MFRLRPWTRPGRRPIGVLALFLWLAVSSPASLRGGDDLSFLRAQQWQSYSVEQGLTDDDVREVIETPSGRVWVRCLSGLAVGDGYWFSPVSFSGTPLADDLRDSIRGMVADPGSGVLLVCERSVWRADGNGIDRVSDVSLPGAPVDALLPITADDWWVVAGGKLYRVRRGAERPTELPIPAGHSARRIVKDRDDAALLYTERGLFRANSTTPPQWTQLADEPLDYFAEAESVTIRVTRFRPGGRLVDWIPGEGESRQTTDVALTEAAGRSIVAIDTRAEDGLTVIAYGFGLVALLCDGELQRFDSVPPPFMDARAFRFTRSGDLWVATKRGLHRFVTRPVWRSWSNLTSVSALCRVDDELWVGTRQGVGRITDDGVTWLAEIDGQALGMVTSITRDRRGWIWLGSGATFEGVFCFDGVGWRHYGRDDGLDAPRVHRIVAPPGTDDVWFLSLPVVPDPNSGLEPQSGGALCRWHDGRIEVFADRSTTQADRLYDLTVGRDGSMWVATDRGILRHDANGRWHRFGPGAGLVSGRVFTLAQDADDVVWFGHQTTAGGLGWIDPASPDRVHYVESESALIDKEVWGLVAGADGALWISSVNGLGVYRDGYYSSVSEGCGIPKGTVWPVLVEEGRIWFGTLSGEVFRTEIPLADVGLPRLETRTRSWSEMAEIEWRVRSPMVTPQFHYDTRFRIDGEEWSPWSPARRVILGSLSAGSHVVEVEAKTPFGRIVTGPPTEVHILSFYQSHPEVAAAVALASAVLLAIAGFFALKFRRERRLLRRRERELQNARRMEALGTLAGGIAHDFNNLVTTIRGNARLAHEALDASTADGERPRRHVERVIAATERAERVVDQILAFGKQNDAELGTIEFTAVARESLQLLEPTRPANVVWVTNMEDEPLFVRGDDTQIQQIMINLVSNATHATKARGGTIKISLAVESLGDDDRAELGVAPAARYVVLSVRDDGEGMSAETRERAFEPFFTTKGVGEGTGLGLAAVHGILARHGGACRLESTPGDGTHFRLYFPLVPAPGAPPPEASPAVATPSDRVSVAGGARVLLVDDDVSVVELGGELLTSFGHSVTTETDSRRALERFREETDRFDVVVTDQTMPHLTGAELAEEIHRIRAIPVVLSTGYSFEPMNSETIAAILMKPYDPELLDRVIREQAGLET